MTARILINCSNLHNGGGVAVATSVIDCLSRMPHGGLSLSVLLSTPVKSNLNVLRTNLAAFESCETCDFYGISALWQGLNRYFRGFDLVFTVFGPAYFTRRNTRHMFGFAQPNIIYPDNPVAAGQPAATRWLTRLKFELQAWFFSRADAIVVELEHVKTALKKRRLFRRKPVDVVYSSVHSVFLHPENWSAIKIPLKLGRLRLGLISRNYPHKNLAVLPEVKRLLRVKHGRDVDLFVTFSKEEWDACDSHFRKFIVNVGPLSLSQCPTFYEAMDGVVFPSLLECFSAVPLETMIVGKPLFASNLSFIRDVCGNHCQYIDPQDPADIARVIDAYFRKPASERQALGQSAYAHARRYPGPEDRAASYLKLIHQTLA